MQSPVRARRAHQARLHRAHARGLEPSTAFHAISLTLPYLTLPYLTLPYLTLPYLTLPHLTSPYLTLPHLTSPYRTVPYLTLPYLTLPCLLPSGRPPDAADAAEA